LAAGVAAVRRGGGKRKGGEKKGRKRQIYYRSHLHLDLAGTKEKGKEKERGGKTFLLNRKQQHPQPPLFLLHNYFQQAQGRVLGAKKKRRRKKTVRIGRTPYTCLYLLRARIKKEKKEEEVQTGSVALQM